MSRVYVFLADGFEEIEGLTVVDILRRAGVDTTTVSIMERRNVMGSHKIPVMADACFGEVDFSEGELLVLPGGMPGSKYLAEHKACLLYTSVTLVRVQVPSSASDEHSE